MSRPLIALIAALLFVGVLVGVTEARTRTSLGALRDEASGVRLTSDDDNALRGALAFTTRDAQAATVRLEADDHRLDVTEDEPTTRHDIPLLGLRADRDYRVTLTVGEASHEVGTLATDPLPDDLPDLEVLVSEPERMTPGLTLFDTAYRPPAEGEAVQEEGFLTAVDAEGEVVWYHRDPLPARNPSRLDDGSLLFLSDDTGARRIAPDGTVLDEWRGTSPRTKPDEVGAGLGDAEVTRVDVHQMHHEIDVLPNGNYVTLSRQVRSFPFDEPLCTGDGEPAFDGTEDLVTEVVVEFDPETGEKVREYPLLDRLDPADDARVLANDYCLSIFDDHFPGVKAPRDWTHGNAVTLDEDANTLVVSLRHTDQLLGLRWQDDDQGPGGELLWTLGPDSGVKLEGDGEWFFHQHAPEVEDDGEIMLYDNGNGRPGTDPAEPGERPYSRAVAYAFDAEAGTARQTWEHRLPAAPGTYDGVPEETDVFAGYLGDADRLDGGTVLINHGGQFTGFQLENGVPFGRVIEVDEDSGDVVFDLVSRDDKDASGYAVYRAERIPTIYPEGYSVEESRK